MCALGSEYGIRRNHPLFFITICCISVISPVGAALLVFIRFVVKDMHLARNILITVTAVSIIAWSFPTWQLIGALPLLLRDCGCDSPRPFGYIGRPVNREA